MSDTPRTDAARLDEHDPAHAIAIECGRMERELTESTAENTRLRAALASSKDPCPYCQLPNDEMAKCRSGFPGCARADDLMGCPELGAALEVERLERELSEAKIGAARYEYLRKLNPRQFSDLVMFCNTPGIRFDNEVDRRRSTT